MEINHLSFAYGKNRVLEDVNLTIEPGKITTILGANGSGKTTLFSLMTKNLMYRRGVISLGGKSIKRLDQRRFAMQVAIVHQQNTASSDTTVERLVWFGRTPYAKALRGKSKADEEMVHWALEVTGLLDFRHRAMDSLSGGQKQRVWIAMALAQGTPYLFLDEPTTYLDIKYQLDILRLIANLNKDYGITIVMVLHDINQAIHYSHTIVGLKDGRVLCQGPPEEVVSPALIHQLYGADLTIKTWEEGTFVLAV